MHSRASPESVRGRGGGGAGRVKHRMVFQRAKEARACPFPPAGPSSHMVKSVPSQISKSFACQESSVPSGGSVHRFSKLVSLCGYGMGQLCYITTTFS